MAFHCKMNALAYNDCEKPPAQHILTLYMYTLK